MNDLPAAFFVRHPSRIEDIRHPHLAERLKPYMVEKVVTLAKIDYENFTTDLCVDRWFIEENMRLCRIDECGVWHCIFVRQRGCKDGVLVMSKGQVFPRWAAYLPETEEFE